MKIPISIFVLSKFLRQTSVSWFGCMVANNHHSHTCFEIFLNVYAYSENQHKIFPVPWSLPTLRQLPSCPKRLLAWHSSPLSGKVQALYWSHEVKFGLLAGASLHSLSRWTAPLTLSSQDGLRVPWSLLRVVYHILRVGWDLGYSNCLVWMIQAQRRIWNLKSALIFFFNIKLSRDMSHM